MRLNARSAGCSWVIRTRPNSSSGQLRAAAVALVVATTVSIVKAAPVTPRQAYERARADYFTLKGSTERQKLRHNWLNVIAGFNAIADTYGESTEAPAAVYTMAELWADLYNLSRRDSDLDQALSAYERVVQRYPDSSLADDALFQRAQIYLKTLKNRPAAARAAREIMGRYKEGDMASRAQALVIELADVPDPGPEVRNDEGKPHPRHVGISVATPPAPTLRATPQVQRRASSRFRSDVDGRPALPAVR